MAKWILVSSHRRSGTHFLIDSIRLNVRGALFPAHRHLPRDFNIAALFQEDELIYEVFSELLNRNRPTIIKAHLLPEEMNLPHPRSKYERLMKEVFEKSYKLYAVRNGKDTMASLYRFLCPDVDFCTFLRTENDYISPLRAPGSIDSNRVRYWSYHISSWSKEKSVHCVPFEDLKLDYEHTMAKVLRFIDEPPVQRLRKPQLPRSASIHRVKRKLYKLGLLRSMSSTSVKPGQGNIGTAETFFTAEANDFFEREVTSLTRLEHGA